MELKSNLTFKNKITSFFFELDIKTSANEM